MVAPGIPPYGVEFESIPYPNLHHFKGALQPNEDLENIEYLSDKADYLSLGYLKVSYLY